jgi:hypothetical protein
MLIVFSLSACNRYAGSCKSFTGKYPEISFSKGDTFVGRQAAIARGRRIVAACYPLHPIQPEGGAIGFNSAVKAKDGSVYLTYNIQLWSDVRLAFKIDDRGEVLGGYQYSTYGNN